MDRVKFFDDVRSWMGPMGQPQVDGIEALLNAGDGMPLQHMAFVLANVHHETGGYMFPIKETVFAHHKDKNPSDATVRARLDRAWQDGNLPWVKTPYWRDGWFGRGQIQITHMDNYRRVGKAIGVDLVTSPARALEPAVSAKVAVMGMALGLFTGKKLSDYNFPHDLQNPPATHPRRIVNGQDGSDDKVSRVHGEFVGALDAGGWGASVVAPATDWVSILRGLFKC